MLNGGKRVWPAAEVRIGKDTQIGRILAIVGDGSAQRELIASARRLEPSERFPGLWELYGDGDRFIGLAADEEVHANADVLAATARERARRLRGLEDVESDTYTGFQVWAMVIGALLLGAAAVFFGRG